MGTLTGNVVTLANSIIGVSVLAMPYCFKQCGIVLAILMLLFSNIITRLACHYLMKSAIMEKRKNFEMLAFRVFGPTGKLFVELCIIGFMLGTCVAYFVIMGDLGPVIVGPIFGMQYPTALRPSVLIAIAVFVVLPLGLLKNVDSLSAVCAATIAFYFCLVLKVMGEAVNQLVDGDWVYKVYYWRPSGILQCIPIFSMALSCQTQLFEVFDSLPSSPLDRMNAIVRSAINMVTLFYISVGFFGYIAYCDQTFSGNLMMNFSPTITSDVIKIGFLLSVAVSFPLVIFPCRASIHSLLFSKGYEYAGPGWVHISETRFKCITLVIVSAALVTSLLIPNIEVVLGLVGSTIGVIICVIIPGIIFVSLSVKNNNERLVAKLLVCIGLVIMVLGTYANLYATENAVSGPERNVLSKNVPPSLNKILEKVDIKDESMKIIGVVSELGPLPELKLNELNGESLTDHEKEINKIPPVSLVEYEDTKNGAREEPLVLHEGKKELQEALLHSDVRKEPPLPQEALVYSDKEAPDAPESEALHKHDVIVGGSLSSVKGAPHEPLSILRLAQEPAHSNIPQVKPVSKGKEKVEERKQESVVQRESDSKVKNSDTNKVVLGKPVSQNIEKPIKNSGLSQIITKYEITNETKLNENIIEKIKEHEEAQRKLNEEGKEILKEIKKYVNITKGSVKLVNVKTGVVTNVNSSKYNQSILETSNFQPDSVKEGLGMNVTKGVPLPLVLVKEQLLERKQENFINPYKENKYVNKQQIQSREKRDVREVNEKSIFEPSRTIVKLGAKPQSDDSNLKETLPMKGASLPQASNASGQVGDAKTLATQEVERDNCVKNVTNASQVQLNEVLLEEKEASLIKSPSYLSNINPVLNASPLLLNEGITHKGLPEMPQKRDLKSLSSQDLGDSL